jgi:plasmid stabilization system protein ParE
VVFGRFSHAIYFVLSDDEKAIVVAVLHQSRATVAWKRRIGSEGEG